MLRTIYHSFWTSNIACWQCVVECIEQQIFSVQWRCVRPATRLFGRVESRMRWKWCGNGIAFSTGQRRSLTSAHKMHLRVNKRKDGGLTVEFVNPRFDRRNIPRLGYAQLTCLTSRLFSLDNSNTQRRRAPPACLWVWVF